MLLDQHTIDELKSYCKDDHAFERVRTLLESYIAKANEIEADLQHTIDTLQGEVRERLKLEANLRIQNIIAQLSDSFIVLDKQCCITLFNERAKFLIEQHIKTDVKVGDNFLNLVRRKSFWKEQLERAFRGEVTNISSVLHSDILPNKTTYYEARLSPVRDSKGDIQEVVILTVDITKQKERELELLKLQRLLSETEQLAKIGSAEYDIKTDVAFWTEQIYRIYERDTSLPPLKHETFFAQVHPDDLEKVIAGSKEAFAGKPYDGTFRIITDTGKVKWVRCVGKPVIENGEVVRLLGAVMDISEAKEKELALQRSEQKLSAYFNSTLEAIILLDTSHTIIGFNKVSLKIASRLYPDKPLKEGNDILTYMPLNSEIRRLFLDAFQKTLSGERVEFEYELILPDETIWWNVNTLPIESENKIIGVACVCENITHKKEMEAQRELLYQQLLQAQKMEAIGVLASGVAHEFNNILAGILGAATLLKKEVAGHPKGEKRVNQIEEASRRAAVIVKQMLGFARQGKIEVRTVDLRECITTVLDLFEPSLDKRIRVTTNFQVDENNATVQGDKAQLQQVVLNLAVNARDAIMEKLSDLENPEIAFELTCEAMPTAMAESSGLPSDERVLHLAVRDNGIGISKDVQDKIFEPFFTTKEVGKGTGLGLSMVYGVVKNHRGFLSVESELGKGTTFHFYFPIYKATNGQINEQEMQDVTGAIKGTILLVDDEQSIRESLTELLEEHGYFVYSQSNGKDGLAFFEAHQDEIDVAVIDKNMPCLDGEQLLSALKQIRPHLPIILATGSLENACIAALEQKGASRLLIKPFEPKELLSAISSALQVKV
ncbi:MAG: PAS domain-containing hybrid sensor histidine kinase/response regulator [Chlorobiales bacterium]